MSKYREIVYMVIDEIKLLSDDASFNEDHIMFLIDKYRALLLKQTYSNIKKQIPKGNYQEICLELETTPAINGEPCTGGYYLKSKQKIPNTIGVGNVDVYPLDFYQGDITYVSNNRLKYIGYNKFLKNIIYCSINPNGYLYFKSNNPQHLYLEKVKLNGIFENVKDTKDLKCNKEESICDILDIEYPLEEGLIPQVIQMVVKELLGAAWRPEDSINNANDDLSNMSSFIRRNLKSDISKQLESNG